MSDDKIIIDVDDIAAVTPPPQTASQQVVTQTTNWSETLPQNKRYFIAIIVVLNFVLTLAMCGGVGYLVVDKFQKIETKNQPEKKQPFIQLEEPENEEQLPTQPVDEKVLCTKKQSATPPVDEKAPVTKEQLVVQPIDEKKTEENNNVKNQEKGETVNDDKNNGN
ncbi:MAG: hypothetical protein LBQ50_03050 [Planctomycetaceae bacterium]|jgi:hypothetical protein|nr:hypothetical protein [Planctomycetaceae bacterium]